MALSHNFSTKENVCTFLVWGEARQACADEKAAAGTCKPEQARLAVCRTCSCSQLTQGSRPAFVSSPSQTSAATSALPLQASEAATWYLRRNTGWYSKGAALAWHLGQGAYKQNGCLTHCCRGCQTSLTLSTAGKDHTHPEHPPHKRQAAALLCHSSVSKLRETKG